MAMRPEQQFKTSTFRQMRRLVACGTAVVAGALAALGDGGAAARGNANLVFGVVSDVHVRDAYPDYLENAFVFFRDAGVDAVMLCGDIANSGKTSELCRAGAAWDAAFPGGKAPDGRPVEKIFVMGNHDFFGNGPDIIRRDPDKAWRAAFHEEWAPVYAKTVKGYAFIGAHWGHERNVAAFVKENAESLGLRNGRPFFYVQHPYPKNTLYHPRRWGDDRGAVDAAFGSYSNAVVFSGHTHEPLTNERAIWQGAFTAIGAASLFYIHSDSNCENGSGRKSGPIPQMKSLPFQLGKPCLVVRVYDDRIVCERWDVAHNEKFGPDRVIPLDGSRPYAFEPRAAAVIPPEFPEGAGVSLSEAVGPNRNGQKTRQLTLSFPAAPPSKTSRVHHYEIRALADRDGNETAVLTNRVFSEAFFLAPGREPATGRCVIAVSALPEDTEVRFAVRPVENFGKRGEAIVSKPWRNPSQSAEK